MIRRLEHEVAKTLLARRNFERERLGRNFVASPQEAHKEQVIERDLRVANDRALAAYREALEAQPHLIEQEMLLYLGSPYNHADPAVRKQRFEQVCHAAALIMGAGMMCYSPIAHAHPINELGFKGINLGWGFWGRFDKLMLHKCDVLGILKIEGWEQSVGLTDEREEFKGVSIVIDYQLLVANPAMVVTSIKEAYEHTT